MTLYSSTYFYAAIVYREGHRTSLVEADAILAQFREQIIWLEYS